MPLGYKYAERNVDTFVDWSAVGKNLSDALATEAKDRRDKIQAFEDQNLADIDYLNRAPQGEFTDATNFTNNFAHDAKQQSLINYKLLTSGKMDPRQFTLNRQNMMNGTNLIFDLQKTYQAEFTKTMEGVQSGDLQALNLANMSMVEKYGDFTKSKAVINPLDGTVNIGMMQMNPKTGVMELSKDVMPVSLAMNKITTKIKTFKVDDAINKSIAAFGDRKDAIYSAATTVGAGTITELLGVEALAKYPKIANFKNTVDKFNEAINTTIASYFAGNQYNLSSVLTENVGKYNAESYTYDKDLAAKDKTKLLLKVDPNTKLNVLDESAPHFAEQKKEAEAWVRTQIMSRLDSERKIAITSQLNQLREKPRMEKWEYDEVQRKKLASNIAEQISFAVSGNATQVDGALRYFQSKLQTIGGDINRYKDRIEISQPILTADGKPSGESKKIPYYFTKDGKIANALEFSKSLISAVDTEGVGEDYIKDELPKYFKKGSNINTSTTGSGGARLRNTKVEFAKFATDNIATSDLFTNKDEFYTVAELQKRLFGISGLTIETAKTVGNEIVLKYGDEKVFVKTNEDEDSAMDQKIKVLNFLAKLPEDVQNKILGDDLTEQKLRTQEEQGKGELD